MPPVVHFNINLEIAVNMPINLVTFFGENVSFLSPFRRAVVGHEFCVITMLTCGHKSLKWLNSNFWKIGIKVRYPPHYLVALSLLFSSHNALLIWFFSLSVLCISFPLSLSLSLCFFFCLFYLGNPPFFLSVYQSSVLLLSPSFLSFLLVSVPSVNLSLSLSCFHPVLFLHFTHMAEMALNSSMPWSMTKTVIIPTFWVICSENILLQGMGDLYS